MTDLKCLTGQRAGQMSDKKASTQKQLFLITAFIMLIYIYISSYLIIESIQP